MRINFIAQIDPYRANGGGEMTNRALLDAGKRMGHQIKVTAAFPSPVADMFEDPDLVMLSNVYNQPCARTRLSQALIDHVIYHQPYVQIDNAYVDICDLPYIPCNGNTNGRSCPLKLRIRTQAHRLLKRHGCFAQKTVPLYNNARLTVFVSPLQRRITQTVMGEEVVGNYFELRPLVDSRRFYNQYLERDIENLFVGAVTEAKGLENLRRMFPDGNITLVGPRGIGGVAAFGHRLGKVSYEEVPRIMNRAKNFIYLPRWPEPMGRVVIEASLCGCNLITNDHVGATSFPFDISDPGNLVGATDEFWEVVGQVKADVGANCRCSS